MHRLTRAVDVVGRAPARRAAAAVVGTLLLAGCGSYSKHDFVSSANAICASTVRQLRAVPPPTSGSTHDLGAYLAQELPIVQSENRQIHALRHPSQSKQQQALLTGYLSTLSAYASDFEQFAKAAAGGDRATLADAESSLRNSPVAARAASYGLSSCASAGATIG